MYTEIKPKDVGIDPETGMPKVLKYQFWEIVHYNPEQYDEYYWYERVDYARYILTLREEKWVVGAYKTTRPWYLFGFKKKTWIEGHNVIINKIRYTFSKADNGDTSENADEYPLHALTREIVVEVAKREYAKFLNTTRLQAETASLVGKYPPKKIWEG